jgi:UDP-N-acetylmuramyl pentapeptide synthase
MTQMLSVLAGRGVQEAFPRIGNLTDAALQMLRCPPRQRWHVLALDDSCADELTQISTLCAPHIVAINFAAPSQKIPASADLTSTDLTSTDRTSADLASQLIEELPVTGLAVVDGDHPIAADLSSGAARIVRVGTSQACEWQIQQTVRSGWRANLTINGRELDLVVDSDWSETEVATTLAVAAELGLSSDECAAGFRRLRTYYEQHELLEHDSPSTVPVDGDRSPSEHDEVPPSVSGLRESDTTLPPGLKRKAC